MVSLLPGVQRRVRGRLARLRLWLFLRPRVTGRIKLRGEVARIAIDPTFRCDGDLWLGVYSADGSIAIGPGVSASGPLTVTAIRALRIGSGVLFGPNVLVTDHYHGDSRDTAHRAMPPSHRPLHSPGGITIGDNVQLGANAVLLSPAELGDGAIVGANAVVKGTIAPMAVATGLAISPNRCNGAAAATREG